MKITTRAVQHHPIEPGLSSMTYTPGGTAISNVDVNVGPRAVLINDTGCFVFGRHIQAIKPIVADLVASIPPPNDSLMLSLIT